jgi:putative phosphoribosyl transferase
MAGLQQRGFATLLTEVLLPAETEHGYHSFDFDLLARRITELTESSRKKAAFEDLPIGYFGVGTDASAIAAAAAKPDFPARALVFCDGRPDLVQSALPLLRAPTLLIVADHDLALDLNRNALARLRCPCDLAMLHKGGGSLASPGMAAQTTQLAGDWFEDHLRSREAD